MQPPHENGLDATGPPGDRADSSARVFDGTAQSEDEFTRLYLAHATWLHRWARSRGMDEHTAEDLVHEAFIALLLSTDPIAHMRAWLARVTGNKATDVH